MAFAVKKSAPVFGFNNHLNLAKELSIFIFLDFALRTLLLLSLISSTKLFLLRDIR